MTNTNKKAGWIGVDLDKTLAYDEPGAPFNPTKIGDPIPEMVERVKAWIVQGIEVRIFTARASDPHEGVINAIEEWCEIHIGKKLQVTNIKDYEMIQLWDDRAIQVEPNTGRPIQ